MARLFIEQFFGETTYVYFDYFLLNLDSVSISDKTKEMY